MRTSRRIFLLPHVIIAFGRAPPIELPWRSARSSSAGSGTPFSTSVCGVQELIKRYLGSFPRHVIRRRRLKIQCTDTVRTGIEQNGELIDVAGINILALCSQFSIDDDAAAPCVGSRVANTVRHIQPRRARQDSAPQRQFRFEERNGILAREIASPVVEVRSWLPLAGRQSSRDDGCWSQPGARPRQRPGYNQKSSSASRRGLRTDFGSKGREAARLSASGMIHK